MKTRIFGPKVRRDGTRLRPPQKMTFWRVVKIAFFVWLAFVFLIIEKPWFSSKGDDFTQAAGEGNLTVVKQMLKDGISADETGEADWTALYIATYNGHFEIVKLLIAAGADPNKRMRDDGSSPLIVASEHENADMVRYLLDHGADPKLRDSNGRAAFDVATDPALKRLLIHAKRKPLK